MFDEIDSLHPDYDGSKGRFYLSSIFGAGFCHDMMADFDLPECHDEIDWDDEDNRARWMHFCVAFIPIYLADSARIVEEFPEHLEAHRELVKFYEAQQVALREAMRHSDPDGFALYHPGDAVPEWLREIEPPDADAPPGDGGPRTLFGGLGEFAPDIRQWNQPNENGETEWRLGWLFWRDFSHPSMTDYGLPPTYAQIDWREPQQSRAWLRFCLWFFPVAMDYAQRNISQMPPEEYELFLNNFRDIARLLDAYIPVEAGDERMFGDDEQ